jgi:hypothetical protein
MTQAGCNDCRTWRPARPHQGVLQGRYALVSADMTGDLGIPPTALRRNSAKSWKSATLCGKIGRKATLRMEPCTTPPFSGIEYHGYCRRYACRG